MTETISSDPFIDQIMRAIVSQFFESPQLNFVDSNNGVYVQPRATPVQLLSARLLVEKNDELLDKIMEKMDLDSLAEDVADRVHVMLTKANTGGLHNLYNRDPDDERRKVIKEKVDARLVELMAADLFAKMQEKDLIDEQN